MPQNNPTPWFRTSRNSWFVTLHGRQIKLGPDREKAFTRYHELMLRSNDATPLPSTLTVLAILGFFADWAERHLAESSYGWYCTYLESFARSLPVNLLALELRPFHVTRWLDAQKGWGDSSRRGAITAVKRAYKWAVDEGYIPHSPIASIKKPATARREAILTWDQRELLLNESTDEQFRNLLNLMIETGVRPQEIRALEARHFDQKNGLWIFPAAEHKTGQKTGKPRVVYLTPLAMELSQTLAILYPSGAMLRNRDGKAWTANALRCRFRRLRKRLEGKLPSGVCAYTLRHTYATDALERGVDPVTVAELMGHRDATMVSRVYQHVAQRAEHMQAAAQRVRTNPETDLLQS